MRVSRVALALSRPPLTRPALASPSELRADPPRDGGGRRHPASGLRAPVRSRLLDGGSQLPHGLEPRRGPGAAPGVGRREASSSGTVRRREARRGRRRRAASRRGAREDRGVGLAVALPGRPAAPQPRERRGLRRIFGGRVELSADVQGAAPRRARVQNAADSVLLRSRAVEVDAAVEEITPIDQLHLPSFGHHVRPQACVSRIPDPAFRVDISIEGGLQTQVGHSPNVQCQASSPSQ